MSFSNVHRIMIIDEVMISNILILGSMGTASKNTPDIDEDLRGV